MAVDGEVVYELRVDDSQLESDLNSAQRRVERSAEETADRTEQISQETSESVRETQEEVTEHHRQQNDERVRDDEETGREREKTERSTGERIKAIAGKTAQAMGAGMLAAAGAAIAVGGMAIKSATEMDQAMNQFIASTDLGKEHTEKYQTILEDIYKNNYGESFEDIAQAMSVVRGQMTYLDDAGFKNITEDALAFRDVFGYEVSESVRAADSLVENFGITAEEAFNLMAQGAQYGLDFSGELLDSINEYAPHFKKIGMGAEDMFQVFASGTNAGAFNLDKIGDAVKELSIRVIDGSDATVAGFEAIGLNADEMAKKFGQGGDAAKEAFQEVIAGLGSMEDPLKKNEAGVSLFGTMWEDLGGDVITSLAEINDGIGLTVDTMGELQDVKADDLGSMLEGLKRSVEMLLVSLGEELIPVLTDIIDAILPVLQEALPPLIDIFGQIIEQLAPLIEELLPILLSLFEELLTPLTEIISAVFPVLLQLIGALSPVIEELLQVLNPLIECFMQLMDPVLLLISEGLVPLVDALLPVVSVIMDLLIPALQMMLSHFQETFSGAVADAKSFIQIITNVLNDLVGFVKNVFTGNWSAAWENVKNIFTSIAEAIGQAFKRPINFIIDSVNGFLKGLNKIKIPDWVPVVGGEGFHLPTIPRLKTGIDFVPGDYFPAYLDYGERVLTQEQNARFMAMGGLGGMERALSGGMTSGRNQHLTIRVPVQIDGREVARATADYTSEQMVWEEL